MAHPIAAIATGFVRSGIGILRMSGDGCIDLANKVFTLSSKKPMSELPDRLLSRGTLYDEQSRPIDEAMVFVSRAPHSYTGEDTVEFQCHGSPAVLRAGLSALLSVGFRQAGPGEFTKRAFLSCGRPARKAGPDLRSAHGYLLAFSRGARLPRRRHRAVPPASV